ncbi:MAG: M56 family metallopeptidase [Prevotellaceae bacterium]|jgi:TonB family protein|nr:M56 family metallopeptidase [Prevotellaceae bacterium]
MISTIIHHPLIVYAFQVVACSLLFWVFYKGGIEKGKRFGLNRSYLLFAIGASVVIPMLSIPVYSSPSLPIQEILVYQPLISSGFITEPTTQTFANPLSIIFSIYLIICGLLSVKLLIELFSLLKIYRSGTKTQKNSCLVILSPRVKSPFSFIRTIFLPSTLESNEESLFLKHEEAHIKSGHSFDILLFEIVSILFWFNPIFRVIGRELRKIHEYQADRLVASNFSDLHIYQTLIAQESLGFIPRITHPFNHSLTKKRIIMLTHPPKSNRSLLRIMLIIPIIALNLSLFSFTVKQPQLPPQQDETVRFEIVEVKPIFQGGDKQSFAKWVMEQIVYPPLAKEQGIKGRVMLSFLVDTEGNVGEVTVLRGVDPLLDEEAVRAVSLSPKWTPGFQKGKAVKVRYNFPIIFALKDNDNATTKEQPIDRPMEDLFITAYATGNNAPVPIQPDQDKTNEVRFETVEEKPMFQGDDEWAFAKWVGEQILYPQKAKENMIQGRVTLSFVVDTNGNVVDITVLRGIDPLLDEEAIRVVSLSPQWTPGVHEGKKVNVRYNFPVHFALK